MIYNQISATISYVNQPLHPPFSKTCVRSIYKLNSIFRINLISTDLKKKVSYLHMQCTCMYFFLYEKIWLITYHDYVSTGVSDFYLSLVKPKLTFHLAKRSVRNPFTAFSKYLSPIKSKSHISALICMKI